MRVFTQLTLILPEIIFPRLDAKVSYEYIPKIEGGASPSQSDSSSLRSTIYVGPPKELNFSPNLLDFLSTAIYTHQAGLTEHSGPVVAARMSLFLVISTQETGPDAAGVVPGESFDVSSLLADTVVQLKIEASNWKFTCLPKSPVECVFQLPSVNLVVSSFSSTKV